MRGLAHAQAAAERDAAALLPQVTDKDRARIDKLRAKEEAAARAAFEARGGARGGRRCVGVVQ